MKIKAAILTALLLTVPLGAQPASSKLKYEVGSSNPGYDIALFVYDAQRQGWPSFCMGRPEDGGYWTTADASHPVDKDAKPGPPFDGRFEVHFVRTAQNLGDQSRRVLGETIVDGKTDVWVRLLSVGETRDISIRHDDDFAPIQKSKKNPEGINEVERTKAKLELTVRGVKTTTDAELRVKRNGKTSLKIEAFFSVTGKDLGLTRFPGELNMRLYVEARLPKN